MRRWDVCVTNQESLNNLSDQLTTGWVPDPVLMPTGRPNVVEGVGAIYHLIKPESDEEFLEYFNQMTPEIEKEKPDEFAGVTQTQSLAHGLKPLEAGDWRVYKVYEKNVIWLLHEEVAVK